MEIEDAINTALLTLKEGFEGIIMFNLRINYSNQYWSRSDKRRSYFQNIASFSSERLFRWIGMKYK